MVTDEERHQAVEKDGLSIRCRGKVPRYPVFSSHTGIGVSSRKRMGRHESRSLGRRKEVAEKYLTTD